MASLRPTRMTACSQRPGEAISGKIVFTAKGRGHTVLSDAETCAVSKGAADRCRSNKLAQLQEANDDAE